VRSKEVTVTLPQQLSLLSMVLASAHASNEYVHCHRNPTIA
jgi:hypothetical protein